MAEGHSHQHDHKPGHKHDHRHDWHENGYVDEWVAKNEKRTERSALIQSMLAKAGLPKDTPVRVLDVGGGYGYVSAEVLKAFPRAQVTLQDFSEPMIERAREFLSAHAKQMHYSHSDLTDRSWGLKAMADGNGPFDLVVSAIAIHNVRDIAAIGECYRDIRGLLKPGGSFLNCDHVERAGGIEKHVQMLRDAGFKNVETMGDGDMTAILVART